MESIKEEFVEIKIDEDGRISISTMKKTILNIVGVKKIRLLMDTILDVPLE